MLTKTTAYECPNGHLERTKERAVAWHLVSVCKEDGKETVSFSDALQLCKHASQVIALLQSLGVNDYA